MNTRPLSELPNREGFRFVGERLDGTRADCQVGTADMIRLGKTWTKTTCQYSLVARELLPRYLSGWLPE